MSLKGTASDTQEIMVATGMWGIRSKLSRGINDSGIMSGRVQEV